MPLNTEKSASVTDAMISRITVRGFLDKPVPEEILKRIFDTARRTASGGNLQPWRAHVMTGNILKQFTEEAAKNTLGGEQEGETFPAYPSPLWEPQRSWRYKLGEEMYAQLGIPRENKMGRLIWLANNAKFFEAPVGIIITGHKDLLMPQHLDVGIYVQSLMLLAREEGLHTAPQGWWRRHPKTVNKYLDVPEEEQVLVGMAMGYGDPDSNVNNLVSDRADFDELVHFYT